jgi:hypothetical protein
MTQEALKLAEIIEHFDSNDESLPLELLKEISATLRALAQTQEPWCMKMNDCKTKCEDCPDEPPQRTEQEPVAWISPKGHIHFDPYLDSVPLYTTPPQRSESSGKPSAWVGLTDEQLADCMDMSIQKTCRAIEAKLKELNT